MPGSNLRRAALFGIINYGISMTSLEEVFLRLAEIAESEEAEVERLEDLGRRSSFSNIATDPKPAPGKHNKRLLPNLSDILAKYDPSLRSNALHVSDRTSHCLDLYAMMWPAHGSKEDKSVKG